MSNVLLILSATVSETVSKKSVISTLWGMIPYLGDVLLRLIPPFVAIYIGVRNDYTSNKRTNDAKAIAFLENGVRLYSVFQLKISELSKREVEVIIFRNNEKLLEFEKSMFELHNAANECKMWQYLQLELFNEIKTFDISHDVSEECTRSKAIMCSASEEISKNSEKNIIVEIENNYSEKIENLFSELEKKVLINKDILIEELKKYYPIASEDRKVEFDFLRLKMK